MLTILLEKVRKIDLKEMTMLCVWRITHTMEKLKFAIAKADCSIDDNYIHNFSQYYSDGDRSVDGDVDVEMNKAEEDAEKEHS